MNLVGIKGIIYMKETKQQPEENIGSYRRSPITGEVLKIGFSLLAFCGPL